MHDSVLERVTLRRSLGAKYLTTPAPSKEDYAEALTWAIAAPDHCHLSPARFVVIEERQKFSDFFEAGALADGADQEGAQRARSKALKAPAMVAVVAKIDEHNERVPTHEQWMTVGAATSNFLAALELKGFAGKIVSGSSTHYRTPSMPFARRAKSSPAGLCSARQNRMLRAPKSVLFTTNC